MNIGALIIGDELLSGKRQDQHFNYLQKTLAKRGLELSWTIIVGDEAEQLERFLNFSLTSQDLVFSFGGIGATPDDRTRQSVAKVSEVELYTHPDALAEIEAQFGKLAYPNRILMAELPKGSRIIPNPINRVPGFSMGHHHFMPGFPEMSWPMVEWILETHYPNLKNLSPQHEQLIYIKNGRESDLIKAMEQMLKDYPSVLLSSLPHLGEVSYIEFSIRGDKNDVERAMSFMKKAIEQRQLTWSDQFDNK